MVLSSKSRLKKKKDFDRVFQEGKPVRGAFLFAKVLPSETPGIRVGFSVPVSVFKKATDRNRIRRILSERARLQMQAKTKTKGYDIVIIVSKSSVRAQKSELEADLDQILKKYGITSDSAHKTI